MCHKQKDSMIDYKELCGSSVYVAYNMNDVFHYASSDREEIYTQDIEDLKNVINEFGLHETLVAYTAIKRGYDPQISDNAGIKFESAKKEILKLVEITEKWVLYDLKYHMKKYGEEK